MIPPFLAQTSAGDAEKVTITVEGGKVQVDGAGAGGTSVEQVVTPDGAAQTLLGSLTELFHTFLEHLPQIGLAMFLLFATGFIVRLLLRIEKRVMGRLKLRQSLSDLFAQLLKITVWFLGIMLAAAVMFPGFGFTQIMATAGLASIAIGFAFKDIFENFFAGILILWNYPFEVGDFIEVEGAEVEGKVEEIWIRVSLIRKTDGQLIVVPNSTLYTNPVRVLTSQPVRRQTVMCGIAYDEDADRAREVIEGAVRGCSMVDKDYPIQIFAQEFGESSMDFEVTWWSGSAPVQQRRSRDEVVRAVKRTLSEQGIEIPYPYRTLTFKESKPLAGTQESKE